MAIHKLGEKPKIEKIIREPGKHSDGGGLYLQVAAPGQGSWVVRFGERWKSLGPVDEIGTDAARALHAAMKAEKRAGRDPFREVEAKRAAEEAAEAARTPFADVVEGYLTLHAPRWKGGEAGHEAGQYRRTLAGPLSALGADAIGKDHVKKHLEQFPPARADKVRIRIMQVLDYAVANGLRPDGENPARKEIMKHLVPSAPKSTPHAAMALADVPALMADLVADGSPAARSLAFLILTAARTAEARDADWSEIKGNVWTVPASRMKEGAEHSVPLSDAALALLGPAKKSGRIFGDLAHDALIDELKARSDVTVHGFRSAFNGWAVKAKYPKSLWGRALAHAVGNKTDQAYDRETLIEERRPMMLHWSEFATGSGRPPQ
jgi:integrase